MGNIASQKYRMLTLSLRPRKIDKAKPRLPSSMAILIGMSEESVHL